MFNYIKQEAQYYIATEGYTRPHAYALAIISSLQDYTRSEICNWYGHRYHTYADPESGSETIVCTRCGDSQTHYF